MDGHSMGGMGMMTPPSSSSMNMPRKKKMMMMHMSFYWGDQAEILFSGWPGSNTGKYVISLIAVFILAFLVEWLSRSNLVESPVKNNVVSGILRTVIHGVRMGVAYLVMLAVMSYNVGIFIAVILGHAFGFLCFGSRVFGSGKSGVKQTDLDPMSC